MLKKSIELFRQSSKLLASRVRAQPNRNLYTENLEPYPHNYINTKKWPSQANYRETWTPPDWHGPQERSGIWLMRIFWTYLFSMLFHDPGVITGHYFPPDPNTFTDEQLGIPPDDEGLYTDWLRNRELSSKEVEQ